MRHVVLIVAALYCAPLLAQEEEEEAPPFDYLYLQGGFDYDASLKDGPASYGMGVGASVDLGSDLFLTANYGRSETEEFELAGTTGTVVAGSVGIGGGKHWSLRPRVDVNAGVAFGSTTLRGHGGFTSAPTNRVASVGIGGGVRYLLRPRLEVGGGVGVTYAEGDIVADVGGSALWRMTRRWGLAGSVGLTEDNWGVGLGLRSTFPIDVGTPGSPEGAPAAPLGEGDTGPVPPSGDAPASEEMPAEEPRRSGG